MTTTEEAIANIRRMEGALWEIASLKSPVKVQELRRIARSALRHSMDPRRLVEMARNEDEKGAVERGLKLGESGFRATRHRIGQCCFFFMEACPYCKAEKEKEG